MRALDGQKRIRAPPGTDDERPGQETSSLNEESRLRRATWDSVGRSLLGVPNAGMWGLLVAVLNFVPYFGPVAGILFLTAVGVLTFDTLWIGLLPPGWYLLLHPGQRAGERADRSGGDHRI